MLRAPLIVEGLKRRKEPNKGSHCSRKASEEHEKHSRHKRQKLRNKSFMDKSQMQDQRKVREVSRSESSEDEKFSCRNDDNEVDYL